MTLQLTQKMKDRINKKCITVKKAKFKNMEKKCKGTILLSCLCIFVFCAVIIYQSNDNHICQPLRCKL